MALRVRRWQPSRDRTSLARWRSANRPAGRNSPLPYLVRWLSWRRAQQAAPLQMKFALTPLPRLRGQGLGVGATLCGGLRRGGRFRMGRRIRRGVRERSRIGIFVCRKQDQSLDCAARFDCVRVVARFVFAFVSATHCLFPFVFLYYVLPVPPAHPLHTFKRKEGRQRRKFFRRFQASAFSPLPSAPESCRRSRGLLSVREIREISGRVCTRCCLDSALSHRVHRPATRQFSAGRGPVSFCSLFILSVRPTRR